MMSKRHPYRNIGRKTHIFSGKLKGFHNTSIDTTRSCEWEAQLSAFHYIPPRLHDHDLHAQCDPPRRRPSGAFQAIQKDHRPMAPRPSPGPQDLGQNAGRCDHTFRWKSCRACERSLECVGALCLVALSSEPCSQHRLSPVDRVQTVMYVNNLCDSRISLEAIPESPANPG